MPPPVRSRRNRQIEPYVRGQTTYSTVSPRAGNTRTSWLSGAVPWAYYSATQYILGIRPEIDGLRIDPCIPRAWKGFKATRQFRGKQIEIEVTNPEGVCQGVSSLTLNGQPMPGEFIPADRLAAYNR
jgi:cellobiose phosphorylase